MGVAYSQDLRDRVMAAVDCGLGVYSAAPLFRVSVSYIYKALGRRRATGDVTAHKSGGGPKPKLAAYDEALRAQVAQKGDVTLIELQAWLAGDHAVKVSVGCLWARVRHLRLSARKKSQRAAEQDRADVAEAREQWRAQQGEWRPNNLVFVDETGASTKMDPALRPMPARRAPGRAGSVGPLEDHDLHRRAAAGRSGRALRVRRADQRREVPRLGRASLLAPELKPGDIVILDNLPSHKVEGSQNGDRERRRPTALLAFLQSRSQPDRAVVRQTQGPAAQSRGTNLRRPDPGHRKGARNLHPRRRCANYLANSGYRRQ